MINFPNHLWEIFHIQKWITYQNSIPQQEVDYDNQGKKILDENYVNGKVNGIVTEWYPNDQVKSQVNYIDDLKNGKAIYWNENGVKDHEENYINGQLDLMSKARIKNYNPDDGDLYYCPSSLQLNSYVIIQQASYSNQNRDYIDRINTEFINSIIQNRSAQHISDTSGRSNDTIVYKISILSPEITTSQVATTDFKGNKSYGWSAQVKIMFKIQSVSNPEESSTHEYTFKSFQNYAQNSQLNAVINALDNSGMVGEQDNFTDIVAKFLIHFYPVYGQVSNINGVNEDIKLVNVSLTQGLPSYYKKMKLYAFDEAQTYKMEFIRKNYDQINIGELSPKEINGNNLVCKVKGNKDKLTEALKDGKKVFAVTIY